MTKFIVPLILLSFGSSVFLMFGIHLLQVCSDHKAKDVKTEYIIAAVLIWLSLIGWIWFYNLLT